MVDLGTQSRGQDHREMMLRVWAGNDFCQTLLRGGLSIGSGEADDVHIQGAGVAAKHAHVFESQGQLTLLAGEGQVVHLPDGKQARVLILTPGVCFGIGDAILQCWQAEMPDEPGPPVVRVVEVGGVRCEECKADLSRVPAEAQYCPRCGRELTAKHGGARSWVGSCLDPMDEEMPPPPFDPNQPVHSQVIFGYAAAMHNLGVRYEEGRKGTPRNMQEAVRCYIKSARLGNDRALDRLTGR